MIFYNGLDYFSSSQYQYGQGHFVTERDQFIVTGWDHFLICSDNYFL